MRISYGIYYQAYGYSITEDIPEVKTTEQAKEWLREHWDELPLPIRADYVMGSDELDEESIMMVK